MKTTLVSLISDQLYPNLVFIKDNQAVDHYLAITTQAMELAGKSTWLRSAVGIEESKWIESILLDDPNNLTGIIEQLQAAPQCKNDQLFIVNITGGTKPMSLAAYEFFKELPSQIFYVPIGKNFYWKIFPKMNDKIVNITYQLSLSEYLTAYGFKILAANFNALVRNSASSRLFYKIFFTLSGDEFQVLNKLRQHKKSEQIAIEDIPGLAYLLKKIKFRESSFGKFNKDEIRYITGGWFEEWIYSYLKDFFKLDGRFIGTNITITRLNKDGKVIKNEFDVMFIYNNTLHIIECKTEGVKKQIDKNRLNEYLNKLQSVKKEFGLHVPSHILTLGDFKNNKQDVESVLARARLFGVNIYDRTIFESDNWPNELVKNII